MFELLVVIGIVLLVILLMLFSTYNSLMDLRSQVRARWANIDEQLKQRYDLVPQLLTSLQAAGGEAATKLSAVSLAKNQAAVAFNPSQLASAEIALTVAIHDLLAVAEKDAGLSNDSKFEQVRQSLILCEKRIDKARKAYNDQVEQLNESLRAFPSGITAAIVGLRKQPLFELPI